MSVALEYRRECGRDMPTDDTHRDDLLWMFLIEDALSWTPRQVFAGPLTGAEAEALGRSLFGARQHRVIALLGHPVGRVLRANNPRKLLAPKEPQR